MPILGSPRLGTPKEGANDRGMVGWRRGGVGDCCGRMVGYGGLEWMGNWVSSQVNSFTSSFIGWRFSECVHVAEDLDGLRPCFSHYWCKPSMQSWLRTKVEKILC